MKIDNNNNEPPPFVEQLAASYIGKYILVGLTYLDHEGKELQRQQLHGIIKSATKKGIQIKLKGIYVGQSWNMPPDLRSIYPAQPGKYTLKMSEEVIENPDLLSTWTINKPAPNDEH